MTLVQLPNDLEIRSGQPQLKFSVKGGVGSAFLLRQDDEASKVLFVISYSTSSMIYDKLELGTASGPPRVDVNPSPRPAINPLTLIITPIELKPSHNTPSLLVSRIFMLPQRPHGEQI